MTRYYACCTICGGTITWEHGKRPDDIEVVKRRHYPTLYIHKNCILKEELQNEHIKSKEKH